MGVVTQKFGYPVKHIGGMLPKDVPQRELYVHVRPVCWLLRKSPKRFYIELKRGHFNGIRIRRLTGGWVYNVHDVIRFIYPYITEDKLADIMEEKLDAYAKVSKQYKKYYLE